MPRDGLSQYAPPPGTNGITNYTIESTKYNGFVADVTQDLNLPRPIVAGGTGANNARDAMTSLQGDVAYQVVTNYDSYAFVSGSFYSAAGATSAPTGNAFIGQCYTSDPAVVPPAVPAGQNMFIEARDVTTGLKYLRQKTAGVWGAWKQQAGSSTDLDAAYVNVSGDQMSGNLAIANPGGSALNLIKLAGTSNTIYGQISPGGPRWSIDLGDAAPESTGNAGSNFYIRRFSDAGGQIGIPMSIIRNSDNVVFAAAVTAGGAGTTGTYYFGNSGAKNLNYDGANFNFIGGPLTANNNIWSYTSPTTGGFYFGNTGTKYLNYDGANFNFVGGIVNAPSLAAGFGTPLGGDIAAGRTATTGYCYFGAGNTKYVGYDGVQFQVVGGGLVVNAGGINVAGGGLNVTGGTAIIGNLSATVDVIAGSSSASAIYRFGSGGTKYLQYNGTDFYLVGGNLNLAPAAGIPQIGFVYPGTGIQSFINDNNSSHNVYSGVAGNTGMYIIHGGSAWTGISDERLPYKRTAKPLTVLDKIDAVQLYENIVNDRPDLFVKAQEFQKAFPHLVHEATGPNAKSADYVPTGMGDPSVWGMTYERAGVVALQGLKELKQLVTELRAEIASLKASRA